MRIVLALLIVLTMPIVAVGYPGMKAGGKWGTTGTTVKNPGIVTTKQPRITVKTVKPVKAPKAPKPVKIRFKLPKD